MHVIRNLLINVPTKELILEREKTQNVTATKTWLYSNWILFQKVERHIGATVTYWYTTALCLNICILCIHKLVYALRHISSIQLYITLNLKARYKYKKEYILSITVLVRAVLEQLCNSFIITQSDLSYARANRYTTLNTAFFL